MSPSILLGAFSSTQSGEVPSLTGCPRLSLLLGKIGTAGMIFWRCRCRHSFDTQHPCPVFPAGGPDGTPAASLHLIVICAPPHSCHDSSLTSLSLLVVLEETVETSERLTTGWTTSCVVPDVTCDFPYCTLTRTLSVFSLLDRNYSSYWGSHHNIKSGCCVGRVQASTEISS